MTNVPMTNQAYPEKEVCDWDALVVRESRGTYDLAARTAAFGHAVLLYVQKTRLNAINSVLIRQLVRAATSVGANYIEADDADTRKDFIYKIGLCRREARESRYWLGMLAVVWAEFQEERERLIVEAMELTRIFAAIRRSASKE